MVLKSAKLQLSPVPEWRKPSGCDYSVYLVEDRLAWIYCRSSEETLEFVEKVSALELDAEVGPKIQEIIREVQRSLAEELRRKEPGWQTGLYWPAIKAAIKKELGLDWASPDEIHYSSVF